MDPSSIILQSTLNRVAHEGFLTIVFVIELTSIGGLLFQALKLAFLTMFNRNAANYWRSFIVAIFISGIIMIIETWLISKADQIMI